MSTRIRPLVLDDADELAQLLAEQRAFMSPWEPVRPDSFYTAVGQREALARRLDRVASNRQAAFAVIDDAGAIVGGVQLTSMEADPEYSCAIGYWVSSTCNGRGYATAAAEEALEYAADAGLHRVDAVTLLDNTASQRVLTKNGFQYLATAPRYALIAGSWQDHRLYQRLLE